MTATMDLRVSVSILVVVCVVAASGDRPSRCNLLIKPGPCKGFIRSYGFSQTRNSCIFFVYGGCVGNDNRFDTEEECKATCTGTTVSATTNSPQRDDRCALRIAPGPCHGFIPTYGFLPSKNKCIPFIYGGCQGNANQFSSEEECNAVCGVSGVSTSSPSPTRGRTTPSRDEACNLSITPGPCEAYIPSFGYDSASGKCVSFVYGGCLGNANQYGTEKACKLACGVDDTVTDAPNRSVCYLPIVPGPCKAHTSSFGYDSETGKCVPFVYGGCQGNANRFGTLKDCKEGCEI